MKRFEHKVFVDAETQEEAIAKLTGSNGVVLLSPSSRNVEFVGYVHPDGKIRECDVPPNGFILIDVKDAYLAVKQGVEYSVNNWIIDGPVPPGTLCWVNGEWRTFHTLRHRVNRD